MDERPKTPSEESLSSGVELSGTGAFGHTQNSPSLTPSDSRGSFTRRRTSRGRIDFGQDPLSAGLGMSDPPRMSGEAGWNLDDDPFASNVKDHSSYAFELPYRDPPERYQSIDSKFSTEQAGPSTASLISEPRESGDLMDGQREEDEVRLTGHAARPGMSSGWSWAEQSDLERTAPSARTRRRTVRYGTSPSPFKKTGSTLKNVSRSLRRASLRVVNLAGFGLEDHVRLDDPADESKESMLDDKEVLEEEVDEDVSLPDLSQSLPIRGRTLAYFSSTSRVRMATYNFLVAPWTEPVILLLIVFNAVVLTIQSHKSAALASDGSQNPPVINGYFHTWEDYALFALFCFFTVEAFARICVSGFLLDPEVPVSSIFSSFSFAAYPDNFIPSNHVEPNTPLTRHSSVASAHSQARLSFRRINLVQRLQRLVNNLARPFALRHNAAVSLPQDSATLPSSGSSSSHIRTDTVQSQTPMMEQAYSKFQEMHMHVREPSQPTFFSTALRSDNPDVLALPFRLTIASARTQTKRNVPYLRHSWNRIDFVAILGFWVSFVLATAGVERGTYHIGIFRALSVLRTARLLAITSGTTAIMRSLKTARPLLASVAYFLAFAMVLFSVIGIQAFKGSYLRSCNLLPVMGEAETDLSQNCGGWIDPNTLEVKGYVTRDGSYGSAKGYICPLGQVCMENDMNPYSNIESFDNIYYSALQVFIVASSNGWSPIMYNMMDAEFFVSCLFFIVCIVILNFWLINLFVAVITNTFAAIRSDTKKSAFGAASAAPVFDENEDGWTTSDGKLAPSRNRVKEVYDSIRWCWVGLALASLTLQATRTINMGTTHTQVLQLGELILTILFDVEIIIRIIAYLPEWRNFFCRGQNLLDLILAIGSTVIQIPPIHDSSVYPWFTMFQLARFYRVILEIPRMKPLLLAVFGNMYGLANMTLFLILLNFVAALMGVQLMRGDIDRGAFIDYGQIYNSFLAAYQLFSSENWTNVLYGVGPPEIPLRQAPVAILYLTGWFSLANFIILQMFIAVINENFQIAEESKRSQQASHYWASHRPQQSRVPWLQKFNPYRWLKAQPKAIRVEQLPSDLVLPMQTTLVEEYSAPKEEVLIDEALRKGRLPAKYLAKTYLQHLQRLFSGDAEVEQVPLASMRNGRRDSVMPQDAMDEETERHLDFLAALNSETAAMEDLTDYLYERRARKADFIRDHPTYDKTFWLFSQKNAVRRACQKLVEPAGGERIFGTPASPIAHPIFQLFLFLAVVGGIVVEAIATPTYRRNWQLQHGLVRWSWYDITETAFSLTLFFEFIIKVIADGFVFTPNAYVRSIWNILDFLVMVGILTNVITGLVFVGGLSRFTRALKALRALRLVTLIDQMRSTFESLIISGVSRILDACMLAILYMIPYAVWGLNIFNGLMKECNDTSVSGVSQCLDEYSNTIYGNSFGFLVPRVWADPSPSTTFSFDTFRASLLILFEIVSLEGWIDVTTVAVSLVGKGLQPQMNAVQFNSIFFLIYNLLGAVIILTLFVSIIIGNFTSKTGSALLTQAQREWIDLQKLIKRQRPAKRPKSRPTWALRAWCFDRAVHKHGWWHRMMTVLFTIHVIALMTQTLDTIYDDARDDFFLFVTVVYLLDAVIRLFGLGWRSFCFNGWNIFDVVVAGGSLFTTIVVRFYPVGYVAGQMEKLFITCIAFKLVQRTNSLNKFFKTAVASLSTIISLLALWLILFMFFAIMYLEVFSMTKWNSAETPNENYTTMGKALVMLAFMTTGEGWNQYMHDFALEYPRCTIQPNGETDCGSRGWAYSLFIAWNLLSMYIFANLFVGVVVDSFYYVFQMSGGARSITREEMRAFKKVWAEFANPKTGFLERHRFVAFFGKLSGIFEVRIYPAEYSIVNTLDRCSEAPPPHSAWLSKQVDGVNLEKLNSVLNGIDRAAIKKRKNLYNRLYHEARISYEPGKGISFTNMLMLLAHHKLIVDRDALVLKDLVVRAETNRLVTDLVDYDRVQSLLLMFLNRRRYLVQREKKRRKEMEEQDIPAIVVDNLPATPPIMTRDITSPGQGSSMYRFSGPDSPLASPSSVHSADGSHISLGLDSPVHPGSQRRRVSDISLMSLDVGTSLWADASTRDSRSSHDEPDRVLSAVQGSMWNDMMLEAEKEEK